MKARKMSLLQAVGETGFLHMGKLKHLRVARNFKCDGADLMEAGHIFDERTGEIIIETDWVHTGFKIQANY